MNPLNPLKPFNSTQSQTLRQTVTPDLLLLLQMENQTWANTGGREERREAKKGGKEGLGGGGGGWKGFGGVGVGQKSITC